MKRMRRWGARLSRRRLGGLGGVVEVEGGRLRFLVLLVGGAVVVVEEEEGRFRFAGMVEVEEEGLWEGRFGGVRWLGMVGWRVLELLPVTGRFGEAGVFSLKAYWWSLLPKLDIGI